MYAGHVYFTVHLYGVQYVRLDGVYDTLHEFWITADHRAPHTQH